MAPAVMSAIGSNRSNSTRLNIRVKLLIRPENSAISIEENHRSSVYRYIYIQSFLTEDRGFDDEMEVYRLQLLRARDVVVISDHISEDVHACGRRFLSLHWEEVISAEIGGSLYSRVSCIPDPMWAGAGST